MIIFLGAMLGTAICGILIDNLGRKNGGMVLALPFAVSATLDQPEWEYKNIIFPSKSSRYPGR